MAEDFDLYAYREWLDYVRDWIDIVDPESFKTYMNFRRESSGRLAEAKRDGWHCPVTQMKIVNDWIEWVQGLEGYALKEL